MSETQSKQTPAQNQDRGNGEVSNGENGGKKVSITKRRPK
jgi:hypothetical protein